MSRTPAIDALELLLKANGGEMSRFDAAIHVGPHYSCRYGYLTVERAVRLGRVELDPRPLPGRRGATLRLPRKDAR